MLKFPQCATSAPINVLGPPDTTRDPNLDFFCHGRSKHGPLVPATRVDLSGFGESLSSDWYDFSEPAPATQKVDMNAFVGRSELTTILVSPKAPVRLP